MIETKIGYTEIIDIAARLGVGHDDVNPEYTRGAVEVIRDFGLRYGDDGEQAGDYVLRDIANSRARQGM